MESIPAPSRERPPSSTITNADPITAGVEQLSVAPSHSPLLSVNSLPLDVMVLVVRLLSTSTRLHTLSFVCKRWRTAALRSFTRSEELYPTGCSLEKLARLFRLLPCLVRIAIDPTNPLPPSVELNVPPTLRAILIAKSETTHNHCVLSHFSTLSSLTYLQGFSYKDCTALPALLQQSSASLTSVTLLFRHIDGSFADLLNSLQLPQLRALAIDAGANLGPLIKRHASQLQLLGIHHPPPDLESVKFPAARDLRLAGLSMPYLRNMIASAPPSVSLKLRMPWREFNTLLTSVVPLEVLSGALTHLFLTQETSAPTNQVSPIVVQLTRLETLSWLHSRPDRTLPPCIEHAGFCAKLISLEIAIEYCHVPALFYALTNLCYLRVSVPPTSDPITALRELPKLYTLQFRTDEQLRVEKYEVTTTMLAMLRPLVNAAPRLESLCCPFEGLEPAIYSDFVTEMQRRGVKVERHFFSVLGSAAKGI